MDYYQDIEKSTPPGAEGTDQGNGGAGDYINFDKDTTRVPVESKLSADEQKILNEASKPAKKEDAKEEKKPEEEKKKKGFFGRLFSKKDKDRKN
jgi:penicillin-binding protein 1A